LSYHTSPTKQILIKAKIALRGALDGGLDIFKMRGYRETWFPIKKIEADSVVGF
jgi:hypothetical protein